MVPRKSKAKHTGWRMKALKIFFLAFATVITYRLFIIQIVNAGYYSDLASGQHSFYKELFAQRGDIYVLDWKDGVEYLAATNEPKAFIYADPRRIKDPEEVAKAIAGIFDWEVKSDNILDDIDEESDIPDDDVDDKFSEYTILLNRLKKENDPYEPVARGVDEDIAKKIMDFGFDGIYFVLENHRGYPEQNLGGHIFGFLGSDQDGQKIGRYGVEGYLQEFLAGTNGYLNSENDIAGRWTGVGSREFVPAQNGGDIVLTIDRTVQYIVCKKLAEGVEKWDADSGTVVILQPDTGRVIAMCNVPDFDPNNYSEVDSLSVFNNTAIMGAYEPGSVFKPITMAGAIDIGAVDPTSTYEDTGEVKIDEYTIRNSDLKSYGVQTMTEVLEKSLNTGMIHVMREMTGLKLAEYIENFGFGKITGIELDTEVQGTIESLDNDSEIYYATASYGQGITVTPLQLAVAYSALANGGILMQPYIVEEKRFDDGVSEKTYPVEISQVISKKTSTKIGAMMVSVIENGYGSKAGVPGYYIAGKTGTAQVAKTEGGGYQKGYTMATFAGFGPVDDPEFAMVVLLDHPKAVEWASDTAAPVFGDIAEFLLQYFEVAPTRIVE